MRSSRFRTLLLAGCAGLALSPAFARAQSAERTAFNIPAQDLGTALTQFGQQSEREIVFSTDLTRNRRARPVTGEMTTAEALTVLLADSGLSHRTTAAGAIIVEAAPAPQSGSAAGGGAEVEALIVTAQKREEDIQDVPIAISAFTQEDLTRSQVAGGPDLITQIPNFSFTKTNFSSYSIQIRGIGTQAISATTDPAVAVAFNNTPYIRNRFFEQEFYDLERLEVLRGPQGTLYGRNATAGVVNIISAKPKFTYQAKLSGDVANYNATRLEGMINIPLVEDVVALRLAGAWTKRDGYATNELTGQQIDGRDLWSARLSLRFEPTDWISANFIYEHFEENDDRLRSGKQLCKKDPIPLSLNGVPVEQGGGDVQVEGSYLSQGCDRVSLYSPEAFQTPNGYSLPFYGATGAVSNQIYSELDPYLNGVQSRDLRVIESSVEPDYKARVDIAELQVSIDLSDTLTLSSETAYGADFLWSVQDYNRFTTRPGVFRPSNPAVPQDKPGAVDANGVFCDPQLGCSDRLMLVDLSTENSTQFSQELRLASDFDGPVNFSLGANYLRHDAEAKYYVFINSLTLLAATAQVSLPDVNPYFMGQDNEWCQTKGLGIARSPGLVGDTAPNYDPTLRYSLTFDPCIYIDPNPISSLNDQGRNYFLSRNPYKLISYAAFGEVYYNLTEALKITAGLRFTVDRKTAPQIPSWLLATKTAGEYQTAKTVFQDWQEPTGRLAIDWKPDFSFTDETLVYGSYSHGYKAGGTNPPPPVLVEWGFLPTGQETRELIPDAFDPEFIDAFEIGTKNTLLDGALTLNLTGFYYDYKGYQVSEIRNRTAVNSNYDSEVWGLEVEADWRATDALRFGFKGGYQKTRIADGEEAIDLMDRTAGNDDWMVIRPFPTLPSNCIVPIYVLTAGDRIHVGSAGAEFSTCVIAYTMGLDPITRRPYEPDPTLQDTFTPTTTGVVVVTSPLDPIYDDYIGFDPTMPEINGGRGFAKQIGGNELPNAPNYTATITADYTKALPNGWLANLHADFHWQSESWWRVFNDHEYNKIDEFYTVNLAAIFTNEDAGWKVMAYVKNVLDETAITGAFLNSDDTGLTTNVFLTEPRLYGLRVTKDFTGGFLGLDEIGRCPDGVCPLTVEIGGGAGRSSAETEAYAPAWLSAFGPTFPLSDAYQDNDLDWGDTPSIKVVYAPSKELRITAAHRFGKTNGHGKLAAYEHVDGGLNAGLKYPVEPATYLPAQQDKHLRAAARDSEEYAISDFTVGKDVGFGAFGDGGRSMFSLGLRHAELRSYSKVTMDGVPVVVVPPLTNPFNPALPKRNTDFYFTILESEREFEGVGPTAAWDASVRLWGDEEGGHADLDWSVGAGVLFGEQTMTSIEDRLGKNEVITTAVQTILVDDVVPRHRTDDVTVPNLSLSLGLSYTIDRVKVSTGYSYDRFFDAIDGGYEEAKQFDRTIDGPYFKIAVGFGG